MIRLLGRRLIIPRGDTGSFSIPRINFEVNNNEVAVFSILDPLTQKNVLTKEVALTESDNVITVSLEQNDTINLAEKKYYWDIKIYTEPQRDEYQKIIGGVAINSYYSAYKLPICEIRRAI